MTNSSNKHLNLHPHKIFNLKYLSIAFKKTNLSKKYHYIERHHVLNTIDTHKTNSYIRIEKRFLTHFHRLFVYKISLLSDLVHL